MSIGLIGKKLGMTRIFQEDGSAVAVTVIDVSDNAFLQKKIAEKDGYSAVQIGYDEQKEQRLNRPASGHFKSNGSTPKRRIREFRVADDESLPQVAHPGVELFEEGQWVDVIGTSKGKGFQGVMKRYNFSGQPQSHGHMMHRRPGGIGAGTDPGKVSKGKKMPGRHGNFRTTVQNLRVIQARKEDNVLLISGAVPGAKNGYVIIRPAIKHGAPDQKLKSGERAPAEEEKPAAEETAEAATEAAAPEAGKE